jgi:hypothetical protein
MSIEINDRTQALWFVELPNGNWMACIEALEGNRFRLTYRFRWYRDGEVWDSKDERNWFSGVLSGDFPEGIETIRLAVQKLQAHGAGKAFELLRGNLSTRDYMDLFMHQEFVHAKTLTKEQYEAEYGSLDAKAVRG